jgi:predicted TIM-barrel fold metal-dependent hydrolase
LNAGVNEQVVADMKFWDSHCHLSTPGRTIDERMGRLMEIADRVGVERVVLSMGLPPLLTNPTPEQLRKKNDETMEALLHWNHRAFGLCYVSGEHVEESLKEIDRCVAKGPLIGIKLWVAKRCNTPEVETLVKRAHELKGLIVQHAWQKTGGNPPGESTPQDVAELAGRLPEVPMVCYHAGGNWEAGTRALRPHKNVYVEIAGSNPTAGFVEMAVREVGAERVVYGSDAAGRSFASQIGKVLGTQLPEATKELIASGNLQRLLTPILKAKGMTV